LLEHNNFKAFVLHASTACVFNSGRKGGQSLAAI